MKRQPINKDNYEEYFLLYVDNELTAAEKASVEAFIEEHPGLKTELDMFLATKLDMEDVKMDGVEDLYKYDDKDLINAGNFEEFQVLSIDNELNTEEQEALDSFHKDHPEAVSNFEWLKKTKLPVEEITFPDKSSLYRTEKKPASIISITWIRYAAAAAVILLAGLFWINNNNKDVTPGEQQAEVRESESQRGREEEQGTNVLAQTNTNDTDSGSLVDKNTTIEAPAGEEVSGPVQVAMTPAKATQVKKVSIPTVENTDQKVSAKGSDRPVKESMAIVEDQQIAAVEKNETRISAEDLRLNKTTEASANATPYVQPAVAMNVKTNYAADALSGIQDDGDEEMGTEGEGKQRRGLRGIVRKANRIYNKVTNPDLDRPLVKVANLEIGLQR
jgi:cytoskeletal protein RodZ